MIGGFWRWLFPKPQPETKGARLIDTPLGRQYLAHRDLYLEVHRRAIFANMRNLLDHVLDSDDPTIGIFAIMRQESGRTHLVLGGADPTPDQQVWAMRWYFENVYKPRREGIPAARGDQVNCKDFEEPTVACGEDDATEAERERMENGLLLARTLLKILRNHTYRQTMPPKMLDEMEEHIEAGLVMYGSEVYYAEHGNA